MKSSQLLPFTSYGTTQLGLSGLRATPILSIVTVVETDEMLLNKGKQFYVYTYFQGW